MATAQNVFGTQSTMTVTLASLANGAGRVATQIDFADGSLKSAQAVVINVHVRMGAVAPTAGKTIQLFWARGDENGTPHIDGGLATTDTGYTTASTPRSDYVRDQLQYIGSIPVQATASADYYATFVVYTPGPRGSLYVYNDSGQSLDATGSNHYVRYQPLNIDVA